jgi:hypothetical protein
MWRDCTGRIVGLHLSNSRHAFAFSRRVAPEVCRKSLPSNRRGRGECRVPNAPAAWCALKVVCAPVFTAEAPESSGIPHAMVLRLMAYSPRRRIRLASVAGELTTCPRPVGPTCLRRLDTSNGCQDHTLLPYASAPFVLRDGTIAHEYSPALRTHSRRRCRVHRIPPPTFVTIASRPSYGVGRADETTDFRKTEAIYFSRRGWTGIRERCPSGKSLQEKEKEVAAAQRFLIQSPRCRLNGFTRLVPSFRGALLREL